MANKKKSSRVLALILAVIMLLSIVPVSIFAANELGTLRDGKAAISSDMTAEQIKDVLFNTLVKDRDGKDAQSLEWEYYCTGYDHAWDPAESGTFKNDAWGSIFGFESQKKVALTWHTYQHKALGNAADGNYSVRLAGETEEVTLTKVSSCTVNFDYDAAKGDVLANSNVVAGEKTGFSPKSSVILTVAPKAGYAVESVKVNGVAVAANEEGAYEFLPVAETTVEVTFAEAGTFHEVVLPEVEGVSYKVNGFDAKGSVRVNNEVDTVIEYITDSNTSIACVKMNNVDVTENVVFANYNGTQTLKVTENTEIAVETVKTTLIKTEDTVVPVIADENGNWDTAQIRQAIIDTVISKDSPIGHFDSEHFDVQYSNNTTTNSWADITYTGSKTFRERVAEDGVVEVWLKYKGDNQYRPSYNDGEDPKEFGVYQNITVKDLPGATIAVRSGEKNVTLYQNNDGSYNYEALRKDIYKIAIDESNSTPAGVVSYDKVKFTYKLVDGIDGGFGDAGEFYPFEKDSSSWDEGNTFKYLYKGGKFTIRAELPSTESYYGTSVEFEVNVTVAGLPTAEISVKENAPASITLYRQFDRTYDYAALKNEIFEQVLEIKNIPENVVLTADNLTFTRYAGGYVDASGFKELDKGFVPFEGMKHPTLAAAYYQEIGEAGEGEYTIKVALPTGSGYFGTEFEFKINIDIVDNHTAEIVVNDGPFTFPLNENGIDAYDYDALKQVIFENVIKEVKNVPADLTWEDFDYSYESMKALGSVFMPFETRGNDLSDPLETARNYLHKGGVQKIKVTLPDGEDFYGAEVTFDITVDVQGLPKTEIIAKADQTVVLNRNKDRSYDYEALKADIFALLEVKNLPEGVTLTKDDITFERWASGWCTVTGSWMDTEPRYVPFEGMDHPTMGGGYYQEIGAAGEGSYKIKVTLPNNSAYYGSEVEFEVIINFYDAYTTKIALKENYQKEFVLNYKSATDFDYDRLKHEIFDAVIDTANSTDNVKFENAQFTYKLVDGINGGFGNAGKFVPFETESDSSDPESTFKYLYKGGKFDIKIFIPQGNGLFQNEVIVSLIINPFGRVKSQVVLNDNMSMNYADVNEVKQYIFDNVIDRELSIFPADATIDDFYFEYWTYNYTAGGILGVDPDWVPLEGKEYPLLPESYYKPIGGGTWDIRVTYLGNTEYSASTSDYRSFTINKSDVNVSFKQNYIYVGDSLTGDLVNTDPVDNFTKYIFTIRTNTSLVDSTDGVINVYREGISETDISVLPSIMFQKVLGKSAVEVYTQGISRAELETLVNSTAFAEYLGGKNLDSNVIEAMKNEVANLPASIQWVWIYAGSPATPGTYRAIAATAHEYYNSGVATSDFYVKYNTKGNKLQWVSDTSGLNSINAKNFDFRAVVTKNGVPQNSDHVKYIYTGFRANFLFYASTTEPPREAGIYTQTAWTSIRGTYCFPKTRTFTISLL